MLDSNSEIGDAVYFTLSEGQKIEITFEDGSSKQFTILEEYGHSSGETGSEKCLSLSLTEDSETDSNIYWGICAYITSQDSYSIEYDIYVINQDMEDISNVTNYRVQSLEINPNS